MSFDTIVSFLRAVADVELRFPTSKKESLPNRLSRTLVDSMSELPNSAQIEQEYMHIVTLENSLVTTISKE